MKVRALAVAALVAALAIPSVQAGSKEERQERQEQRKENREKRKERRKNKEFKKDQDCQNRKRCPVDVSEILDDISGTESITLDFGPGKKRKFNREKFGNNSWRGRNGFFELDLYMLKVDPNDENSETQVFGSASDEEYLYQFSHDEYGNTEIVETLWAEVPEEGETPPEPTDDEGNNLFDRQPTRRALIEKHGRIDRKLSPVVRSQPLYETDKHTGERRKLIDDLGGNLDIMVVWTREAECGSATCATTAATTANILGDINTAIAQTNNAYLQSDIQTELRLVHAYRHPTYVERTSNKWVDGLYDLTYTGGSYAALDDVQTERVAYGADIVAMVVSTSNAGSTAGIGWAGDFPSYGFMYSLTRVDVLVGAYTFAHEVGHNMGCQHDRAVQNPSECDEAAFPNYNYGWRDSQSAFRTVLAYNCNNARCDSSPSQGCARIPRFSHPTFTYNGAPLGNALNDNSRKIREGLSTIAAYEPVGDCFSNQDCDDGDACTTETCDIPSGQCVYTAACPTSSPSLAPTSSPSVTPNFKTLTTTFAAGNGQAGNMFDILALNDVDVISLDIHVRTGSHQVQVYTRVGGYAAGIGNAGAWGTAVFDQVVSGAGEFATTILPLFPTKVSIPSGTTQGFYVTITSSNMRYTNGNSEGAVYASNADIVFYEGRGVPYGSFGGGGTFSPRVWNGNIHYELAGQELPSSAPSPAPSLFPSATPSDAPSKSPAPSGSPSDVPSAAPSDEPSVSLAPSKMEPSATPSDAPSKSPAPSDSPSDTPTVSSAPSATPTEEPSVSNAPTQTEASAAPSDVPSKSPAPSDSPTDAPSASHVPSGAPTDEPSVSLAPSRAEPSSTPSDAPSKSPAPSGSPSDAPSASPAPSATPTDEPSASNAPSRMAPSAAPSDAPSKSPAPSDIPSDTPSASPVPSASPTDEPSASPVPSATPTDEPSASNAPSQAEPSATPSDAPSKSPAPSDSPSDTPSASPVPSASPTDLPTGPVPSAVPTDAPSLSAVPTVPTPAVEFSLESQVISSVGTSWTTVSLSNVYASPIPVCSVVYEGTNPKPDPSVVRMRNVGTTSFEIRLQNPGDAVGSLAAKPVNCVIMEEGTFTLPSGQLIEAVSYTSTTTAFKNGWTAETQSYGNSYTNPVVLGQVMTFNDSNWSVFWCRRSGGRGAPPNSSSIQTGKHVGEDPNQLRAAETIGYIVVEAGSTADFAVALGADTVRGIDNNINGYSYSYGTAFASEPAVKIVSLEAMDGNDGGWAVLNDNQSSGSLGLLIDEDQLSNNERRHTTEQVAYFVFATEGTIELTEV